MKKVLGWVKPVVSHDYFLIGLLIVVNLFIGFKVVVDYGESWDEQLRYRYATKSLAAYIGDIQGSLKDEKGAFYVMVAKIGAQAMQSIRQDWLPIEAWHFMHFLSFLMGLFFLYMICLRYVSKWAAIGAVLLFNTQPLLWGHAFINPKDIPFMSFFLGSIALGMVMVDKILRQSAARPIARAVLAGFIDLRILAAGIFLGLCTSIRVLGPVSGVLIAGYALLRAGRKSIPALIAYFSIAVVVTYLTWPALWGAPVKNFLASFSQASDFPWEGKVMFAGVDYTVDEVPRSYLPTLLPIQFTESAILTFLIGLGLSIYRVIKKKLEISKFALIATWLFLPFLLAVILQPTMYDNFRQFLFLIPPIFVFAGIGLQGIFDKIKNVPISALIVFLLLLPNLYWLVKLHPYQYVYYNSLVGGVRGAFRRYEMDYWGTSYRKATEYLNAYAPEGSTVVVWGPDHIVQDFARSDLKIEDYRKIAGKDVPLPDYAILLSRHDKDISLYPQAKVLFQEGRDGVVFAVVKQLKPASSP